MVFKIGHKSFSVQRDFTESKAGGEVGTLSDVNCEITISSEKRGLC